MRHHHFFACSFLVLAGLFALVPAGNAQAPATPPALQRKNSSLKLWDRKSEVKILRSLLASQGFLDSSKVEDDRFDLPLMEAVRAFQRRVGLKATGVPRRETLLALNKVAAGVASTGSAASLGSRSELASPAVPLPRARPQVESSTQATNPSARADAGRDEGGAAAANKVNERKHNAPDAAPKATAVQGPSVTPTSASPMLQATTQRQLAAAVARYRDIVGNGGWGELIELQEFELGKTYDKVLPLRKRLATEQYLTREQAAGATYDAVVAVALHRFQRNHGLAEHDAIDRATLGALNVSAGTRLAQLESTLARLAQLKLAGIDLAKEPYVLLNIPAEEVQFVEDGRLVASRRAIVGKRKTPSPEVVGFIPSITLNPTWTVPYSIVRKEIVPMLRRNPGYLDRHGMRVEHHGVAIDPAAANWKEQDNIVVQRPGPQNSLGFLRIDMRTNSRAAVYLHDTPQRKLFDAANRYYSHGCARVQDVVGFAEGLLRQTDPALTKEALIAEIIQHDDGWQPGRTIKLKRPIRVIWAYMTAWIADDGSVEFRKDVYQRDKPAAAPASALVVESSSGGPHAGATTP